MGGEAGDPGHRTVFTCLSLTWLPSELREVLCEDWRRFPCHAINSIFPFYSGFALPSFSLHLCLSAKPQPKPGVLHSLLLQNLSLGEWTGQVSVGSTFTLRPSWESGSSVHLSASIKNGRGPWGQVEAILQEVQHHWDFFLRFWISDLKTFKLPGLFFRVCKVPGGWVGNSWPFVTPCTPPHSCVMFRRMRAQGKGLTGPSPSTWSLLDFLFA